MPDVQVTAAVLFVFAVAGIAAAAVLAGRASRRILARRREQAAWHRFTRAEEELGLELHIICVKDQIARHLRDHLGEGGDG